MDKNLKDNTFPENVTASDDPLVSIIVITYNSAKYVLETLESAKAQTYNNIELIISDDASADNTVGVCKDWIENNGGRFIKTNIITIPINKGIPANCNRGLSASNGEWIKMIAGDDVLMPECIETYIRIAKDNSQIEVMHSNVIQYLDTFEEDMRLPNNDLKTLKINQPIIDPKEQFEILLRRNNIWAGSLIVRKAVYEKIGSYDETNMFWEDRPLLLNITKNNIRLYYIDFVSYKYRVRPYSTLKRKSQELVSEFDLERARYFLKNYVKYLPVQERIVKFFLYKRILWLSIISFNRRNFITKVLLVLFGFPWEIIDKRMSLSYL